MRLTKEASPADPKRLAAFERDKVSKRLGNFGVKESKPKDLDTSNPAALAA